MFLSHCNHWTYDKSVKKARRLNINRQATTKGIYSIFQEAE